MSWRDGTRHLLALGSTHNNFASFGSCIDVVDKAGSIPFYLFDFVSGSGCEGVMEGNVDGDVELNVVVGDATSETASRADVRADIVARLLVRLAHRALQRLLFFVHLIIVITLTNM